MELTNDEIMALLVVMERGIKAEVELHNALHAKLRSLMTQPPPGPPGGAVPGKTG